MTAASAPLPPRFTATADGRMTPAMREAWQADGLLVLENWLLAGDCQALMDRAAQLVQEKGSLDQMTVFSTTKRQQQNQSYFLESADKIRCFFEDEALNEDGQLTVPLERAINKMGHALHDLDPLFQRSSYDPRIGRLARDAGQKDPRALQSMMIFKHPHIGGEVTCHQDSTFLYSDPTSVIGFWIALEDATVDNGCLYALPGRHKEGLKERLHQGPDGAKMEQVAALTWENDAAVPLEVPQGSLVLLHGELPHLSGANRSAKSRQAYALHVIDGACDYPADNWLQRPADFPVRALP
ncbi:phytanoyl-CoA dioxygenase family protein [Rhodovibrionaceae bacterium A322]